MQTPQRLTPNTGIPGHVMAFADAICEELGITLPQESKFAMARDIYQETLTERQQSNQTAIWSPLETSMQPAALASEAFELFCGGRAGTGKTDIGIGAAITQHKETLFLRTEYTQFKSIIKRSREVLSQTDASFNANDNIWQHIPGNRTLEFGAVKFDNDIEKYRGREHDLLVFDEIGTFPEDHYLQMFGWARTSNPDQRVRVICTGNPPRPENIWVKRRWAAWLDEKHLNPAKPGELRWFVNLDGKDTEVEGPDVEIYDAKDTKLKPLSRTFIPGNLLDHYKDSEYEATLQTLPEPLRSQLLFGDFSLIEDDQARQVIPTSWIRAAQVRWEQMTKPDAPLRGLAVDVSRGGRDQTVLSKRYNNYFEELKKYKGSEMKTGQDVASVVIENLLEGENTARLVVDVAGIGSSPYDVLSSQGYNVDDFNGGTHSPYTDAAGNLNFANRRAEAWWKFREALDPNSGLDIALPPDPELMADLAAPTWELTTRGIQIELKEKIIKRLGRSPDCGDAVTMNFNIDVRAGDNMVYF